MNYTLANEDTGLELSILSDGCEHVVAVCGSGSRVLPLISKNPKCISVVDVSNFQLALCELRIESMRELSYSEFLAFWGYRSGVWGMSPQARKSLFERLNLRTESRHCLIQAFESQAWNSLLLAGRWERTFVLFSKIAKFILGEDRILGIFECKTIDEQNSYLEKRIYGWRWRLLIALVGNSRTFNAILYRGDFPVNNTGLGYVDYYDRAYRRLFAQGLARLNFFLQLTLLGELRYPEGLPIEADAHVFAEAKKNLSSVRFQWIQQDLVTWLSGQSGIDFVSFSNVASYFSGERENRFLNEIHGSLKPGARVVLRYYLHRPEGLDRKGYFDRTSAYAKLVATEKIQMYDVEVLEKSES